MSKIENNRIYYDPYNEIRCDKFALEKLIKESEEKDKTISDLEAKLVEKEEAIENWQTMYKSVVQTCYNDKEEIERLNKRLETQENTITNLVEDNRASQEWYKKQLADTEAQNKRVLEKLELIVNANQDLEKQLAEKDDEITQRLVIQERDYNQDKISFAVEQLEKFRDIMEKLNENNSGYIIRFSSMSDREKFHEALDNQIKAIKEGK